MAKIIEEASAQLDAAVRALRRLPESGADSAYVLARYKAKKRALAMAVLGEATKHLSFHAEHGQHYEEVRARIAALGGKDAP